MCDATHDHRDFPRYTRSEAIVDGAVHVFGLVLAAVALPWMLWIGFHHGDAVVFWALVLYAAGAWLMLGCSALYNVQKEPRRKEWLRRFDHAAIFIMIAGTYSPLALARMASPLGTGLMIFEWSLALLGATLAIAFHRRAERLCLVLYLLMGWAIVVALHPLLIAIGENAFIMILAGGLIYTVGVGVQAATRVKYHNALWHCCVLGAAACHYVAILVSVARWETPLS